MESNVAELCGVVLSELRFSHKTYGEIFYTFVLGIERRSGYIDEIKRYKEEYSDEKKKADTDCLDLLIKRGIEIPENDITFKKIAAKGVKIRL